MSSTSVRSWAATFCVKSGQPSERAPSLWFRTRNDLLSSTFQKEDATAPEQDIGAEGEDPARLLIVRQAALAGAQRSLAEAELEGHRLRIARAQVGIALRIALLGFVLLIALLLLIAAIAAARSDRLVVDAFDVPELLAASGASGEALAGSVADELSRLGESTDTRGRRSREKIVVERNGASPLARLRRLLGDDRHIGGSVIRSEDGTLRLTVRGDGIEARSFTGRSRDLPLLAARAAEHVYGSAHPVAYLAQLQEAGRASAAADFAPRAFSRARDDRQRATIAGLWAEALARLGRSTEAEEQARLALSLDPQNWHAHAALVDSAADDEAAIAASRALRRRVAQLPANRRPFDGAFATEYRLTQDWAKLASLYGAREGPGRAAFLAEAEAHRHDHQAARRSLLEADPTDSLVDALSDFTAGFRELDLGRADRAVAPLERFNRALLARPELRRLFRGDGCYLALAYAWLGQSRDALRLLDVESDSARCAALRGDVLALAGNWKAASRAYRQAIGLAPSSPVPFERAGAALLARDELEAAERLFQAAIARGSNWADPRFGLAETMMQAGRFSEAERQYRAAARLAPRWGALHLAWGEALWRLGRQGEARSVWRSASGMDLSAPARARLQRLLAFDGGSPAGPVS